MLVCTIAFGYVVSQTMRGNFSVGDVSLFASYIILANQTLITMVQENALLYDTVLFMEKFFRFLDMPVKMKSGTRRMGAEGIERIEFCHVSFTYPGAKRKAVEDLSFTIEKGSHVAFVGENGGGKSTVFKLLCRLYDVTEGQIRINGYDIAEYDISSLRSQMCVVFQDFARYDMTLEENVSISDPEKDRTESGIREALRQAGAEGLVKKLPAGRQQMLGKRFSEGVDLSGGEWQKLSIARAFYRNGSLVMFDEPSAALDAESDELFWNSMAAVMEGKTAVYITHRLSGITFADRIFVLQDGKLIEEGTHRELIAQNGCYKKMYKMQAEKYSGGF